MTTHGGQETPEVEEWSWAQQPGCLPLSRHIFTKWLSKQGVFYLKEEATLLFSEILTNAIKIPSPDGLTLSRWLLYPNKLRVEVMDWSAEAPWVQDPGPWAEEGRGILIVHLIANSWGYEHRTFLHPKGEGFVPGKYVWFELSR
ncbi:ATP-binding protein [Streptomyces sp. NPDC102462]|uniref:ATP-binding protein n=1 Tax=Streptomyces sp. NPDC102462 TaxID=3366178 RepID=UPI00382D1A83